MIIQIQTALRSKIKLIMQVMGILSIGLFLGSISTLLYLNQNKKISKIEILSEGKTNLTNPLLWCDQPKGSLQTTISPFESDVKLSINKLESSPNIDQISYYFRELKTGYWIAIKEDIKFMPASLLKLPLAITIFKQAEDNPEILSQKIVYSVDQESLPQNYTSHSANLKTGEYYPISSLIESMIVDSDNLSLNALTTISDEKKFEELMNITGTKLTDSASQDFITVRQYSMLLRLLYNASYLSENFSTELLRMLTHTQFKDGLVAGLPKNTTIAHKFGERVIEETGQKQLHDCGIIYHPDNPYMLCVMTRGKDFDAQENAIKTLSELTWIKINESLTAY